MGALGHDVVGPRPEQGSVDLSAEALFVKPFTSSDPLWNTLLPRPDIGGTLNLAGKTSDVYAGVVWDYNFTDRVFAETGFGGSLNNGYTGSGVSPGRVAVGSALLFRESASLGYRLTPNWSVMATIEHNSNAGLAARNAGLTDAGIRVGYAF